MQRAKSVDEYIETHPEWTAALVKLHKILNATELEKTVKWGGPCYTVDGKNVVGIAALTPGKQREYANHIASAKQAATKTSRLQKILPLIEAGGGLHDKYRDC